MKKKLHSRFLMMMLFSFASITLFGQTEISDEAGLRAIADDLSGNYILSADITLTADWIPIGNDEDRFSGIIEGNGKTIYGLNFVDPSRDGAGFIGVAEGAIIRNLSIIDAKIRGGQDVAGVVGRSYAPTTVENCYTSGSFGGWDHIGGIIGGSKASDPTGEFSEVLNCFSTAAVVSTEHQAGGIVGAATDMFIENSYFSGIAICPQNRTGGIVALLDNGFLQINNSVSISPYLKGNVTNRVLGDANDATIYQLVNNYSWESTEVYRDGTLYFDGISDSEGFDGEHSTELTLKSASFYSEDLGWSEDIWTIEEGTLPILSFQSYPIDGDAIYIPKFPERPLPGTTFQATPLSALNRNVSISSSDPTVATVDETGLVTFLKDGFSTLTYSTEGDGYYNSASLAYDLVVEGISYEIRTEQDLRNIKYDLEGEFTLMNDITLTQDWELMGTFKGTLNGNGKVIYGLRYDNKEQYGVGLFGNAEGAVVTKLGIENAYLVGNGDVGAIMGNMFGGVISECYVANSYISGRDHVASIAGAMRSRTLEDETQEWSTISNCHSGAHVYSREYQAGGIAGIIGGGILENCYFSGLVHSEQGRATGIVSLVDSDDPGEVRNNINLAAAVYCENTYRIGDWGGRVPSPENDYVRFLNNWSIQKSYYGLDLDGSAMKADSYDPTSRDGSNISDDSEARTQSFYENTLGWDFTDIWKFVSGAEGKMYPVLKWQETPLVSVIYGIPDPAFLIWTPLADANINLSKIIASYGQQLDFEIVEGAQYVERDGSFLLIVESEPSEAGNTKVKVKTDASLDGIFEVPVSEFDIEIILQNSVFEISTAEDFLAINNKLFGNFKLTNNIDLTGVDFYGIGSNLTPFTGRLNGNGYSIINPVVITNGGVKKGLFNATNGAIIEKLGVLNFSFSGSATSGSGSVDMGGLVGSCKSTLIDQCYLTGVIVGRDHVGAFVGGDCTDVTIRNSYADAEVISYWQAGGFFGVTAGNATIENSYFAGSVTTQSGWAGGIIGLIDRAGEIKISNTVSIANVSSGEKAGPFIGGNINDVGTISLFTDNLYNFDAEINTNGEEWRITPEGEIPGQIDFAMGKLIEDLRLQSTYVAIGWDFDAIWFVEDLSFPKLINVPVTTSVPSVIKNTHNYIVYSVDNSIYVNGIESSAFVAVYNAVGQMISNGVYEGEVVLKVPTKGVYILRVSENGLVTSMKVISK